MPDPDRLEATPRATLPRAVSVLAASLADAPGRASAATAEHAAALAALCASALDAPLLILAPTVTLAERIGSLARWLLEHTPSPYAFPRWPKGAESPYEEVVESPFVAAARSGALAAFCLAEAPFAVTLDAATAARRVIPFAAWSEALQRIEVGRDVDLPSLTDLLIGSGYRRTATVAEVGEFAVRGGVVDVFSPFADDPVRIELDGDTVATLKVFDPATQRAQRPLAATWIVPAWDVPADPVRFRDGLIALHESATARRVASKDLGVVETLFGEGRLPAGFPAMLPLMYPDGLDLPAAYVGESVLVVVVDPAGCAGSADGALDALRGEYDAVQAERRAMAPPESLAGSGADLLGAFAGRARTLTIELAAAGAVLGPSHPMLQTADLMRATTSEVPVADRVHALVGIAGRVAEEGGRTLILAPSEAEARRVRDIVSAEGLAPAEAGRDGLAELLLVPGRTPVRVGIGRLRSPFGFDSLGLLVVPSEAVFGVKDVLAGRRGERRGFKALAEFRELAPGDLVIHRDHGIGVFEGMKEVPADGRVTECLVLSYKGGDRLYVPVDRSSLLEKYVAPQEGSATVSRELDRLGSQAWTKRKRSAKGAAREIAGKLKQLYARRMQSTAPALSPPDAEFREFEATFAYETTPDQERAIEEVLEDLARERPMDRLVCGDVGFGKTEVAIRAAYKAVQDGKQVAVLVPTTLLAEQHRLTFTARLRGTPITVESLSRLKTAQEIKRVLDGVKGGSVDIVIGTHRLLSQDVVFRDLGLLVVDEEHRFGVSHKERLREMSANVHTLTLTATPIPRTLHMALAGIRDLSVIATPPRDRLAVKTFVAPTGREVVRSAILRELNRGGQAFFLHNRVEDLYETAEWIQALVPEARVTAAHGQMSGADLESVMSAFVRGDKDVLVCTTIIESGLDIGTANTMLIHRADTLGLAQLYQLRGRVGRAAEQAWCYLLVRDPSSLTEDARKRIEAIERFSELASGFNLASMDLEIRGAGDVLGAEQSGHMAAVGYEMFMEMLQDALDELSGEEVEERVDPELKFEVEARIPPEFIPEEALRLRFYKRLAGARDFAEVAGISAEIADRFGRPPAAVERLVALMRVKVAARDLGVAQVSLKAGVALFVPAGGREQRAVPALMQAAERLGAKLLPFDRPDRVKMSLPRMDAPAQVAFVEDLLRAAG